MYKLIIMLSYQLQELTYFIIYIISTGISILSYLSQRLMFCVIFFTGINILSHLLQEIIYYLIYWEINILFYLSQDWIYYFIHKGT